MSKWGKVKVKAPRLLKYSWFGASSVTAGWPEFAGGRGREECGDGAGTVDETD